MGRTAGSNAAGKTETCFEVVRHNSTRFFDIDFSSIGDISPDDDVVELEWDGKYCRLAWKDDRIVGVNLLNMPEISGILKGHTLRRPELSTSALGLVFGKYPRIREAFMKRGV